MGMVVLRDRHSDNPYVVRTSFLTFMDMLSDNLCG
jgi:hypothetical protein